MKTVIIIPARYASTRYPGKPLVELTLPDGACKSLIQLSWEAACRVTGVDAVYVATDDVRIRDAAQAFGADIIMTSETCRNGTERCAEALENATIDADLVVNLQGDAPLTPGWGEQQRFLIKTTTPFIFPKRWCPLWISTNGLRMRNCRCSTMLGSTPIAPQR
jgi:CMP-2-keto-3-deoxyoctulosonic acid synthetase